MRGVAVEAPAEGGFELAGTSDAMVVRTSSEKTSGLAAATGDVTRLRLGLEGVWRGLAFGGHELEPSLEVGIRHDGGDAETGFGVDIGAGLAWSHANSGVSAEVSARGLLTHAAGGFREQGIAGSLTWDPRPETERGALLTLRQTMGAQASGGMDALLGHTTLAGLTANDDDDELQNRRLELKPRLRLPRLLRPVHVDPGDRARVLGPRPRLQSRLAAHARAARGWHAGTWGCGDAARERQRRTQACYRVPADGEVVRFIDGDPDTYTFMAADEGKKVMVKVTFMDGDSYTVVLIPSRRGMSW